MKQFLSVLDVNMNNLVAGNEIDTATGNTAADSGAVQGRQGATMRQTVMSNGMTMNTLT